MRTCICEVNQLKGTINSDNAYRHVKKLLVTVCGQGSMTGGGFYDSIYGHPVHLLECLQHC